MPDPPSTSLVTTYLFENPWPLIGALLAVAAILLWRGLREGLGRMAMAGVVAALLAVVVFLASVVVTTPGEHARALVRTMVSAAEEGDIRTITLLFGDDATLHFDRPENPGYAIDSLNRAASTLADINRIESNSITQFRAYTVDADSAIVHLGCRTTTVASRGPVGSRWVIHVGRDADGQWRIERITCVSIMNQPPSPSLFRL